MAYSPHANLAVSTVATAPSPATSGTSLVVAAGEGARFPSSGSFPATVWPQGQNPTPANAEIVLVTAVSTDTLTITRAQEGTSARTVVVGDYLAATVTAKSLTDIEAQTDYVIDTQIGTGASGVLTFSSIPATFRELELTIVGRSDTAATNIGLRIAFNSDSTAAHYFDQQIQVSNTILASSENLGANGYISAGNVAGASSTANVYTMHKVWLPEYANTSIFKPIQILQGGALSAATGLVLGRTINGVFESTSAIASMTLTLASGNWTTVSKATLKGRM